MTDHPSKTLELRDVRLLFRNFEGRERGVMNAEGQRNFNVVLDPLQAKELIAEGWRVKQQKPYGEAEEGDYTLKVNVNYKKGRPPRCVVISGNQRVEWGEDEIGMLDSADIEKVDMVISGWWSDMAGGGYGGYLRSIFVTLHYDELEAEYLGLFKENPNERRELAPSDADNEFEGAEV